MALKIEEECTNCDACIDECPNEAIYIGEEIYEIETDKCTECIGFFDVMTCADVCPVDCCVQDEGHVETDEELLTKAKIIHPEEVFAEDYPSHRK
jgi:ferredoxin